MLTRVALLVLALLVLSLEAHREYDLFFGVNDIPKSNTRTSTTPRVLPNRAPVIFSGGLGGSALMLKKDNNKDEPRFFCSKTTKDFFQAWLDLSELIPFVSQPCFLHDMQPYFMDGILQSRKGATVKPKDFGGIEGNAYIGTGWFKEKTQYAAQLYDFLVQEAGYIPGVDLRGATVSLQF
jgi:hypothetical protein